MALPIAITSYLGSFMGLSGFEQERAGEDRRRGVSGR
jgi:hypothetical protein